jgi:hypothetical protein
MDPHDFGLVNPHPATKFVLLLRSSILCVKKLKFLKIFVAFENIGLLQREKSSENLVQFFYIYG